MRVRDPLAPSGDSISEESYGTAEKRRQLVFVVHAQRPKLRVEQTDRIGRAAIEAQTAARIEPDEGVAAEVLAALDAFKEKRLGRHSGQRRKRRHRRQRVG